MPLSNSAKRYVALDLHKSFVTVGAVNAEQGVVLRPQRVPVERFLSWVAKHLRAADEVVFEVGTDAWYYYDLLVDRVARVVPVHAYHVKTIVASFVKTDKRDTIALARLLAANFLPEVWVPPPHVRELRAMVSHRKQLVQERTAAKNRLHSLLLRHHIVPPAGDPFTDAMRGWWDDLKLSRSEAVRVRHDLMAISQANRLLKETETELARMSVSDPYAQDVPFLI